VKMVEDKCSQSIVYSLQNLQSVEVMEQMSDVVILPRMTDKAYSCIENRLSPGTLDAKH